MRSMWTRLKNFVTWRKVLGLGLTVAGAFVPALAPLAVVGAGIFGSDFQVGASIGTPIGAAAKQVADTHKLLTAAESQELLQKLGTAFQEPPKP
jgi:hypothetical protein